MQCWSIRALRTRFIIPCLSSICRNFNMVWHLNLLFSIPLLTEMQHQPQLSVSLLTFIPSLIAMPHRPKQLIVPLRRCLNLERQKINRNSRPCYSAERKSRSQVTESSILFLQEYSTQPMCYVFPATYQKNLGHK